MKKYVLCALLAFALLLSSCSGITPDIGNENPPSTPETPDTPDSPEDNPNEPPEDTKIPSISSVDRSLRFKEIARGCEYTSSLQASENYADDGTLLTDGEVPEDFDRESWAGFSKPNGLSIVVDLGSVKSDLADFTAYSLYYPSYGIGTPEFVCFEISNDGNSYEKIGQTYRPTLTIEKDMVSYRIKLADAVTARYVRFTFGDSDRAWLFLGELSVRAYLPDSELIGVYYGDAALPEVAPDDLWPSDKQSATKQNLIAGKTPYVLSDEEIEDKFSTEYYNSIENLYRLTDGERAKKATYSDSALVHFTKALGRTLTFDLSHASAVYGVTLRFLEQTSTSVLPPEYVAVYVSTDGDGWEKVYAADNTAKVTDGYQSLEITFDSPYKARFVRIYFSVFSHVFCDEIEVIGATAIPKSAKDPVPTVFEESTEPGYPETDDFLGLNNLLLSYNCIPDGASHSEGGLVTVEEFLPHVGYYDKSGKLIDTFFDGFLFLPYSAFNSSDYAKSLEGWQFYLDDLYYENRNMDALNQAVGTVADELRLDDYKCTVFTTIIYPAQSTGDIEAQKAAIKWLMDQEYQRFLEGGYDRLTFGGFYWYREFLATGDPAEKELTLFASEYAHSLGFKIFWIPYYCARGYDRWQEYGFDMACMQPNYMFGKKDVQNILDMTAEKTHRLGMCVEIEMGSGDDINDIKRYMEYLAAGVEYGYMSSIKIYYQRGVPGAFYSAWQSEDPWERAVYDVSYLYSKGLLTTTAPDYTVGVTDYICSGDSISGELTPSADEPFRVELAVSPNHGALRLNADGSFDYFPNEGFVGTDKFAVVLNFGYASTYEIVITVTTESDQ